MADVELPHLRDGGDGGDIVEGESVAGKKNGRLVGLAAGLGILVLGTGGIVAGSVMQPPRAAAELPPVSAAVPAGEYTGVCPEPLKLLDRSAEEVDPEFSPVSRTAETRARAVVLSDLGGTVPGSALYELGSDSPLREIAEFTGEAGSTGRSEAGETKVLAEVVPSQDISAATVLTVEPMGQQHPQAGATMTYTAEDGDLHGLAAANCTTPSNDFWLLGASTTVGSSAVLNLYNATVLHAVAEAQEGVGVEAVLRLALEAGPALPADRPPVEDHVVADRDVGDALADRRDDAGVREVRHPRDGVAERPRRRSCSSGPWPRDPAG